MRKRSWSIVGLCSLFFALSGAFFGKLLYNQLTEPGWEHKVPGWWLSEVEMRLADQQRLGLAMAGLLFGRQNGRISESQMHTAEEIAFRRYCEMLSASAGLTTPPGPGGSAPIFLGMFARNYSERPEADPELVAHAIELATTVTPRTNPFAEKVQSADVGHYMFSFAPRGWSCTYGYVITDAAGKKLKNWGSSKITFSGNGQGGNGGRHYDGERVDAKRGPFTCKWDFELTPDGQTSGKTWKWSKSYVLEFDSPAPPDSGTGPKWTDR